MIDIGQYNILKVARAVDFGLYLTDDDGNEVLLPSRYIPDEGAATGDEIKVFVYTDSDDRPIATTETPYATVGEVAYLQVSDVNATGAFLDWGLLKDLLVPYSQQKSRMVRNGIYPVYIYLDDNSKRVAASAKIERFIGNVLPEYAPGAQVNALVLNHTDIGHRVVVDNLHWGMIYDNELFGTILEPGQALTAYVKAVRPDGKIDLRLKPATGERVTTIGDDILEAIDAGNGILTITDRSTPEEIAQRFNCSKKDFKKAVGRLYKDGKIVLKEGSIERAK